MMKVYQYENCESCRKALRFLNDRDVKFESVPIVEKPPTRAELAEMLEHVGDVKKLFNTSGLVYRELKLGEKLPKLSRDEALALLAKNGKLVKRPFVLGRRDGRAFGVVGFKEPEWKKLFR